MGSAQENSFSYNIHGYNAVLIVSLIGDLTGPANQSLEELKQEILAVSNSKAIILNFAQVTSVGIDIFPSLTQLQKSIREKQIELRLCTMSLSIKEKLGRAGILRSNEISEDSKQAIYSLLHGQKRAA